MAFETKYTIDFYTLQGIPCKVELSFDNYSGAIIPLEPSSRPFVLREFNNDEDLYKPLRPQQAEINFVSQTNLSIADFISNSDTYCLVNFYYNSNQYWKGYILQDDVQEEWSDQKHIISLRASENLGTLKSLEFLDFNNNEIIGRESIYSILVYAMYGAVNLDTNIKAGRNLYVISNVYNTVMATNTPPIWQTYVDAKTFSVGDGEYEDRYSVIEKVNSAFSQTILQYQGAWYIYRPEEIYMPTANQLRQFRRLIPLIIGNPDWTSPASVRFDINVGKNETIKPIAPQPLMFIKRPTKLDQINYNYDYPSEVFPNQNFQRGNLITSTSTYKTYTIDNWTAYKGTKDSPVPTTKANYRKDIFDTYGNKTDSYMYLEWEGVGGDGDNWFQSEDVLVSKNDVIDLSFLWRWSEGNTLIDPIPEFKIAQVFFFQSGSPGFKFYLNDKGQWQYISGGVLDSVVADRYLRIKPDSSSLLTNRYEEKAVLSNPMPYDGTIRILFTNNSVYSHLWTQVQIRLQGSINGLTTQNIAGEFSRFTKPEDIRSNVTNEIFMADTTNNNFKGCLFDSADVRLNPTWYRFRYNTESMSFMKQNLIAQWENTRFFRKKIDASFYGLAQGSLTIGLINTIKFVDDDPNKLYAIVNMKEIDFANATWSATLVEVYDSERDTGNETTYPTYLRDYIYK
jgi:hypothetical protein